jgi:hypothetical protein
MPHPSLRVFLDWLQKCQFEVQSRGIQLASGREPKQRSATYDKVEADIMAAKTQYSICIGAVFMNVFPDPNAWEYFRWFSVNYLHRVSYCLLGK